MSRLTDKLPRGTRRVLVGLAGWLILLVGLVLIPYPGPGWVIVFVGLSVLATEFAWARSLHRFAHLRYDAWVVWLKRQPFFIKAIFWSLTCATVIVTTWLLNFYGTLDSWFHIGWSWLHSPLSWFK